MYAGGYFSWIFNSFGSFTVSEWSVVAVAAVFVAVIASAHMAENGGQ